MPGSFQHQQHANIEAVRSPILLLSFALTMTIALGVKAPLDFSVFAAAGGAFLLAAIATDGRPHGRA